MYGVIYVEGDRGDVEAFLPRLLTIPNSLERFERFDTFVCVCIV
jgi:hypothetical protein